MTSTRRLGRPSRWLSLATVLVAVVATLAVSSPASAGTSYFPTVKISTGSGQGVNVKAGVYVYQYQEYAWTKTWATSYGSQNHWVEFTAVYNGIVYVRYHHPNVGTGTWEDCMNGTNTNCPGYHNYAPAYIRVVVENKSTGVCRTSVLSGAAMDTHKQWGTVNAC